MYHVCECMMCSMYMHNIYTIYILNLHFIDIIENTEIYR